MVITISIFLALVTTKCFKLNDYNMIAIIMVIYLALSSPLTVITSLIECVFQSYKLVKFS